MHFGREQWWSQETGEEARGTTGRLILLSPSHCPLRANLHRDRETSRYKAVPRPRFPMRCIGSFGSRGPKGSLGYVIDIRPMKTPYRDTGQDRKQDPDIDSDKIMGDK